MLDVAKQRLQRALEKANNAGLLVKADYSVFKAIEEAKQNKLLARNSITEADLKEQEQSRVKKLRQQASML